MQVYFHPASRAMELLLQKLLHRAKHLYPAQPHFFQQSSPHLIPFFEESNTLQDYLALDDGVMNTYFQTWMTSDDDILADLASRFINRKVFKSVLFDQVDEEKLAVLRDLVAQVGFDPEYYTGIHINFDLPYDIYRPEHSNPRTEIKIIQKDGSLAELSSLSPIVQALTGSVHGDRRFYFPKEMLRADDLFADVKTSFGRYIKNDSFNPNPSTIEP